MSVEPRAGGEPGPSRYRHEAFFYADRASYLEGASAFVRDGLANGSPVLVALPAARIDLLTAHIPADDPLLTLVAMEDVGRNPARIMPMWSEFLERWAGRSTRGLGESIWPERPPDEIAECEHHEALLNSAFDPATDLWLRCPYDTATLHADLVAAAHRTHRHVTSRSGSAPSTTFAPPTGWPDAPLTPVPGAALRLPLATDSLRAVRHRARQFARASGATVERSGEFEVAVSEAITNVVLHAGGVGEVILWRDGARVTCEVRDRGSGLDDPHAGRRRPPSDQPSGRGLWIVNQLCDLVQIRSSRDGTTVRLHVDV